VWLAVLSDQLRIAASVGRHPTDKLIRRGPLRRRKETLLSPSGRMRYQPGFRRVVPHRRAGTHALLTRPPLGGREPPPLDLHVLGVPPAFVLSQDQTLTFTTRAADGGGRSPPGAARADGSRPRTSRQTMSCKIRIQACAARRAPAPSSASRGRAAGPFRGGQAPPRRAGPPPTLPFPSTMSKSTGAAAAPEPGPPAPPPPALADA
jgi:hypothetical protein